MEKIADVGNYIADTPTYARNDALFQTESAVQFQYDAEHDWDATRVGRAAFHLVVAQMKLDLERSALDDELIHYCVTSCHDAARKMLVLRVRVAHLDGTPAGPVIISDGGGGGGGAK